MGHLTYPRLEDLSEEEKNTLYECHKCHAKYYPHEMMGDCDCNDELDCVYSDFCCPNCFEWWTLDYWIPVTETKEGDSN